MSFTHPYNGLVETPSTCFMLEFEVDGSIVIDFDSLVESVRDLTTYNVFLVHFKNPSAFLKRAEIVYEVVGITGERYRATRDLRHNGYGFTHVPRATEYSYVVSRNRSRQFQIVSGD